jgi:Flp pilus assembly protein CpaB
MVGQGTGRQNVLVRADLLIAPQRLLKTSLQMESLQQVLPNDAIRRERGRP